MSAERAWVPDLLLEQYVLGELPEAEKAWIEAALRSDVSLRVRLEELKASDAAILREAPPAEIAAAIRRRMLSSGDPRARGLLGRVRKAVRPASAFLFPAVAAILVLAGVVMARGRLFPSADELARPKGGSPEILVFAKTASGPTLELREGAVAAAGDLLQIEYTAGGARHGAIFSLDGRGTITRHFPELGDSSAQSGPTQERSAEKAPLLAVGGAFLGSGYELDDAPGFERFFIVSSGEAFGLVVVTDALRDLFTSGQGASGSPRLPRGLDWKSFLLRKTGEGR